MSKQSKLWNSFNCLPEYSKALVRKRKAQKGGDWKSNGELKGIRIIPKTWVKR